MQYNRVEENGKAQINGSYNNHNHNHNRAEIAQKIKAIRTDRAEQKAAAMNQEKKVLAVLFLTLVLDLLAFTCILPLFPAILDYHAAHSSGKGSLYSRFDQILISFRQLIGAPDVARLNSVFFGGLLGTIFSFLQFLSSPLLGAVSDVYGRKPILLISVAGSLCSYLLWSQSLSFSLFVLSRMVGGICKSSVTVATAVVSDVCGPAHRGKGMAVIGVSFSVAFIVGPMIGAFFASKARVAGAVGQHLYYFSTPAYFAAALTVLELICIWLLMPETLSKKHRQTSFGSIASRAADFVNPKSLFQFRPAENTLTKQDLDSLQQVGFVYFLYLFIYAGLEFTLTFFTHMRFNYDSMHQGRMYFFAGLLMTLIQGGYVRRIPAQSQRRAAQWGLAFITPAFIIIGLAANQWLFYTGLSFYSIASGVVVPCLTTLVSSFGSEKEKGTIMGVFRSLGALARAFGPLLASAVFWLMGPTICYVTGGMLLLIPYLLLRKSTSA